MKAWLVGTAGCLAMGLGVAQARAPELHVVRHAETGSMPKAVVVSPDGKHLVVTNFGFVRTRNLYWYDPTTLTKIDQTDFGGKEGNGVEAVFSPDSKTLYVSNFYENRVEVVDVQTHKVVRSVDVGLRPKIVILSQDGSKLVVANWDSFAATVYETKNFTQLYKLKTNEHPRGMAITRDGKIYVAGFEGDELDVYDAPDYSVRRRVKACKHVRHMTLSPDDATLYLSCYFYGQLGVWDVATDKMRKLVQIGQEPKSSAVSADGRWVFVANFGAPDLDTVSVVDTTDWKQRFVHVPKMDQGCGLALSPDQKTVWVTGWTSRTLDAIDVSPLGIAVPAPAPSGSSKFLSGASVSASASTSPSISTPAPTSAPRPGAAPKPTSTLPPLPPSAGSHHKSSARRHVGPDDVRP